MLEIEYKYLLPEGSDIDVTLNLVKGDNDAEIRTIPMHAKYFDTENFDLSKSGLVIRARREGENVVLTSKWKVKNDLYLSNGLHERGEANVAGTPSDFEVPNLMLFKNEECFSLILPFTGLRIKPHIEMRFERKELDVSFGEGNRSHAVVSIDRGMIIASGKEAKLFELEIEFKDGELSDFIAYSEALQEKLSLIPETKSKYQRGLELL